MCWPVVVQVRNYYPFGMLMPQRSYNASGYRYGFNGKENDNEVKGTGNQQDYGFRIYDPRLGRFLSVDPITKEYPELTTYQFASNRPIDGIDLDGLEYIKGRISSYGLNKFETTSDLYTRGSIWVKNQAIHSIVDFHEKLNKVATDGDNRNPDPGEALDLSVNRLKTKPSWNKRQENFRQGNAFKQNIKTASGDFAGTFVDLIKGGFGLYGNLTDKKEMQLAYEDISALDNADRLVRNAINNNTFPIINLNANSFYTDLVNFITDGTKPNDNNKPDYGYLIEVWGRLLYDNRDAINNGSYSFSEQKEQNGERKLSVGDGVYHSIRFKYISGNPDPILKRALKLLSNQKALSSGTIQSSN